MVPGVELSDVGMGSSITMVSRLVSDMSWFGADAANIAKSDGVSSGVSSGISSVLSAVEKKSMMLKVVICIVCCCRYYNHFEIFIVNTSHIFRLIL